MPYSGQHSCVLRFLKYICFSRYCRVKCSVDTFAMFVLQAFYRFDNFKITSCITLETFTEGDQNIEKKKEETPEENEKCASVHGLIAAYLSVVLTHAFLVAVERTVAGFLSRGVKVCTLSCIHPVYLCRINIFQGV